MSRDFNSNNKTQPNALRFFYRAKYQTQAYEENSGIGPKMIKNTNFIERVHYGLIDHENNSVIPDENFIVETQSGRVFDFVADSYSLMRLNWVTAARKNLVPSAGGAFGDLSMVDSYKDPRVKYRKYLGKIFRFYNNTHIPNIVGITNISSYEDYVKNFFNFIFNEFINLPLTMTSWNMSTLSSVMDSGLAFSYSSIPLDEDQRKIDEIIDHPSFDYFKNLSLNMGFSIVHNTPNVLLYDLASPAGAGVRNSYGLYSLSYIFNNRFIKTHTIDNELLYNNINIYYNIYVQKNPLVKVPKVECGRIESEYITLLTVPLSKRPYNDVQELNLYCKLRNLEEGNPFSPQKINNIYKKAKYFLKKVDKSEAIGYINNEFKDQVWNKDHGFDDLKKKLEGRTTTNAQRQQIGDAGSSETPTSSTTGPTGGSSGGSSY